MSKKFYGLFRVDGDLPAEGGKVDVWIPVYDIKYCDRGDSEFIFADTYQEASKILLQRNHPPIDCLTYVKQFTGHIKDPEDGLRKHVDSLSDSYTNRSYAVLREPENKSYIDEDSLKKIEKWLSEVPDTRVVRLSRDSHSRGSTEFSTSDYYRYSNVVFSQEHRTLRYDSKIAERRQRRIKTLREKKQAERIEEANQRRIRDKIFTVWQTLYNASAKVLQQTPPFECVRLSLSCSVADLHTHLFSLLSLTIKVAASVPKKSYLDHREFTNAVFATNAEAKTKGSPLYDLANPNCNPEDMFEEAVKGFALLERMAKASSRRHKKWLKTTTDKPADTK